MINKAGVWAHFGSWNFDRAETYRDVKKMKMEEGINYLQNNKGLSLNEATDLFFQIQDTPADQWISSWPSYVGGWRSCTDWPDIFCNTNIGVGQEGLNDVIIDSVQLVNESWQFNVLFVDKNTARINSEVSVNESVFSLGIVYDKKNNRVRISDKALVNSLFTKLYLLDEQVEGFEKVYENSIVKVYEIN
jgi:hypothetical protein